MRNKTITFGNQEVTLIGTEIKTGENAPNFRGVKHNLEDFIFYEETENKIKIISVAPSLDTQVCSKQAIKFDKIASKLSKDIIVINITVDLPFAIKRFCSKKNLENITVISDHKYLDFGGKYGFVIKEMRILSRGVVLIDKDNNVRYVEYVGNITDEINFKRVEEELKRIM